MDELTMIAHRLQVLARWLVESRTLAQRTGNRWRGPHRAGSRGVLPNTWRERLEGSLTQLDGLRE